MPSQILKHTCISLNISDPNSNPNPNPNPLPLSPFVLFPPLHIRAMPRKSSSASTPSSCPVVASRPTPSVNVSSPEPARTNPASAPARLQQSGGGNMHFKHAFKFWI